MKQGESVFPTDWLILALTAIGLIGSVISVFAPIAAWMNAPREVAYGIEQPVPLWPFVKDAAYGLTLCLMVIGFARIIAMLNRIASKP